jgi:hypothetical protein
VEHKKVMPISQRSDPDRGFSTSALRNVLL